jgi:hypothetical protein
MKFLTALNRFIRCASGNHNYVNEWHEGETLFHKFSTCVHCNKISWDAVSKANMPDTMMGVYRMICVPMSPKFHEYLYETEKKLKGP